MKVIANIRVGKAQTTQTKPSHISGVREGNNPGSGGMDMNAGLEARGNTRPGEPAGTASARRSTGINPGAENPIDPRMPHLTPA